MNTTPSVSSAQSVYAGSSREDTQSEKKSQNKEEASAKQISGSKGASAGVKGKHIAQRSVSQWINYGNPEDWDREFEMAVLQAVKNIKKGNLDSIRFIDHFQKVRFQIALKRKNVSAENFRKRRDDYPKGHRVLHYTDMYRTHPVYGYALERAVKLPYDGKHFLKFQSDLGRCWSKIAYKDKDDKDFLRYGLVQGYINHEPIPLTQYIFCQKQEHTCFKSEAFFGVCDEDYIGENKESALWLHTDREQIPSVLQHIEHLIDRALNGDLSVIPSIHWWYVHLAPTSRGSGGTVEMITNTLCRLHGVDLPPWKEGVAPSIETLLEPNEEKFCANYYKLFSSNQDELKIRFQKTDRVKSQSE